MKKATLFLMLSLCFCMAVKAQRGTIIITEVFYDSPYNEDPRISSNIYNTYGVSEDVAQHHNGEFIELYNPTNQPVDLSGWYISIPGAVGIYHFQKGTIIESQGMLIIAYRHEKTPDFTLEQLFPEIQQTPTKQILYQNSFVLNNKGRAIYLRNSVSQLTDIASYRGEGKNDYWQFEAKNGRKHKPIGLEWKSVQRYQILRNPKDGSMQHSENDFTVARATPLQLPAGTQLPDISYWPKGEFAEEDAKSRKLSQVGTINGIVDVSPTGAATYTVPIEVFPGFGGVQPSLALVYSSQAGNGVAGVGFCISGLSAITRVPRTIYSDGAASGVRNDLWDAYALDGNRLVHASGTYGGDGGEYRTELETFARINSRGTYGNNGPDWFEVVSKDGIKYRYGSASGKLKYKYKTIVGNIIKESVQAWLLDYVEYPNGQTIAYEYETTDLCAYIKKISYGDHAVEFIYSTRTDVVPVHFDSMKENMNKILQKIVSYNAGQVFRQYDLIYGTDNFSRVVKIIESNSKGEAYKPTVFHWGTPAGGAMQVKDVNVQSSAYMSFADQKTASVDINGDGITDLLGFHQYGGYTVIQPYIARKETDGSIGFITIPNEVFFAEPNINFDIYQKTIIGKFHTGVHRANAMGGTIGIDLMGTNQQQILVPVFKNPVGGAASMRYYIYSGNNYGDKKYYDAALIGSYNTKIEPACTTDDINNDGKTEIINIEKGKSGSMFPGEIIYTDNSGNFQSTRFYINIPEMPQRLIIEDFDGDGMKDLFVLAEYSYFIYYNRGGAFNNMFSESNKTTGTFFSKKIINVDIPVSYSHIEIGDFNGDGLPDLIVNKKSSSEWYTFINAGNKSFVKKQLTEFDNFNISCIERGKNYDKCFVTDFDGDGKSDLIINNLECSNLITRKYLHNVYWFRSTGNGFTLHKKVSYHADDALSKYYAFGDFNGDGMNDMMFYGFDCLSGNTDRKWRIYTNKDYSSQSGKITQVIDGLDNVVKLTYAPLTDAGVYKPQDYVQYPVANIRAPLSVVAQTRVNPGRSIEDITHYTYQGARLHNQGKGFLGFATTNAKNVSKGIETQINYRYNPDYFNTYIEIQTAKTTAGHTVSATNYTNAIHTFGGKRILPFTRAVVENNALTGVTTSRVNTVDPNGNLTQSIVRYGTDVTEITDYTYTHAGGNGLSPNKANSITHTTAYAGQLPFLQKKTLGYDAAGNLTAETNFANTDKPVTTQYQNFWMGLPHHIRRSAPGMPAVNDFYLYDAQGRITEHTNPLNQATSKTYDPATGRVATETDHLGNTTTYTYNGWGSVASVTSPAGTTALSRTDWATGGNIVVGGIIMHTTEGEGMPYTETYTDSQGRELRTVTQNAFGKSVFADKEYDSKGRLWRVSEPRFADEAPLWTTYNYDEYNRVAAIHTPTGETAFAYSGLTSSTTTNGRTTRKTVNAKGDVVSSTDAAGGTVQFAYHSSGQPLQTTAAGATTTLAYNARGEQTALTDPDAGKTTYEYDGFGRIIKQTDARGIAVSMTYDDAGRITSKTAPNATYTYGYNTYGAAFVNYTEPAGTHRQEYAYDNYGRLVQQKDILGSNENYTTRYEYDTRNRVTKKTYPSGFALTYGYSIASGDMTSISQAGGGLLWQLEAENSRGQATRYKWGNNSTINHRYNNYGFLTNQYSDQFDFEYQWNTATGNLTYRRDNIPEQEEYFSYDNLDRLKNYGSHTINYQPNGNISYKTGVGGYMYDAAKPHAIVGIDSHEGDIPLRNQRIAYNAFGKVATIAEGADSLSIRYGVGGQRLEGNWYKGGEGSKTRKYLGDYEIHIPVDDDWKEIHYISAPTGLVAVMVRQNDTDALYYTVTDHLGSLAALVNEAGRVVETHSYDAWGRERNPDNWDEYVDNRGILDYSYTYTGHETLWEFGLVNMNGRVYDPVLGRMLSPDNYVQSPLNAQNYNRYGYCLNNPLIYTDPSGEFIFSALLPGVGIFIDAACWGAVIGSIGYTVSVGFSDGGFSNWNWGQFGKAAGFGAASGVLTAGIGQAFGAVGTSGVIGEMGRAVSHGVANGMLSGVQGGNFLTGFATGGLSSLAGSAFQAYGGNFAKSMIGTVGFSSLSGGIGAELTGGNFWEGAATGAIVGLLNHEHEKISKAFYKNLMKGRPWDEQVGIWLRMQGVDEFDKAFTNAAEPVAQGGALLIPTVSITNDVTVLSTGQDIYGNNATTVDKVLSGVDIVTLGASSKIVKIPSYLNKAANYINKGVTWYSSGKVVQNGYKK